MVAVLLLFAGLARAQSAEPEGRGAVEVGVPEVAADARETIAQARAALDAGRFSDAASLYGALAAGGGGAVALTGEAIALYESGDLRAARKAAEEAVKADPGDPAALNVLGLVLVDGGSVTDGMKQLEGSRARAHALGRPASEARATVNLALARVDLGDVSGAIREVDAAEKLAVGDDALLRVVAGARAAANALGGTEASVGALLGKGQIGSARKAGESALAAAKTTRQRIGASLDLAAVDRAEGRLDEAAKKLAETTTKAREAGMVREQAIALADLGLVQGLGGRSGPAADTLRAAARMAQGGGYRVVEVDARCELGFQLLHAGDLGAAEAEQRAAGALLGSMEYPQGVARQAELGGAVAGQRGDLATAKSALGQAAAWYARRGRNIDAARAATALAAAWEQVDPANAQAAAADAERYFAAAGDSLGPAHVKLARALANARAKRLEPALRGFAEAAAAADKVGGGRGTALARIARDNAAATLVMLGSDAELARLSAEKGLGELVARQKDLTAASSRYDEGLAAYNTGRFTDAHAAFADSRARFEALKENEYALRARRGAAWATYNALVLTPTAEAATKWPALVAESTHVEDAELYARAYGAGVMVDHVLGQKDVGKRLIECVSLATRAGIDEVAARCHGGIAERPGELKERAEHAREAARLDKGGSSGVYALYCVAVDAHNAGEDGLALELAKLARPRAGKLAEAIDEVIAAAGG